MAVNSHGVVAGTGEAPGAHGFAWVYRNGSASRLPNVPGYDRQVEVWAVDGAGDVVGAALSASGEHSVLILWPAATPDQPQVQTALTDKLGNLATAKFAGDGQLYAWDPSATTPSVWTRDGQRHPLALPDGFAVAGVTGVHGAWAYGVASRIQPSGHHQVDPGALPVPVRWRLDSGVVTVLAGTVLEWQDTLLPAFLAIDTTTNGARTTGYVALGSDSGRVYVLPVDGGAATPVAISDDGSLVAGSIGPVDDHNAAGNTRPAEWRC
jgi:hypothetical protein